MRAASLMQSPWWLTAGWMMIHYLWIGGVVGLFAAAGRWLLANRPERRYAFAVACITVLSIAPGFIIVCLHPELPIESSLSEHSGLPLAPAESRTFTPPIAVADAAEAAPSKLTRLTLDSVVRCLPWLWLVGTPLTFLMVATGLIGSERLRRQSERLDQGDLAGRCRRLAESLGVRCHVALGVCARLTAPILVGIFKPMILLPPAALSGWSVEQLEMVLLHELAHVRRWDNLVNLLQRIVEAILFFHPVVWWLSAWIRLERELCCDQVVVTHTGNPRAYAETLAAFAVPEPILRTGALAMGESRLVIRIRRILNLEDRSMKVSTKWFGLTTALLAAAFVAVGLVAYGDPARPALDRADDQTAAQEAGKKAAEPRTIVAEDKKSDQQTPASAKPTEAQNRTVGTPDDAKKPPMTSQSATVEPYQQVQLYSRVAGVVKTVMVDVGDGVKRGQVLVVMDAPDAELELRQKMALVQQAKAEINQARSSVRAAEAVLEAAKALAVEAEAGVQGAKANYEFRKKQLERLKGLFENKAIDASLIDEAREKLEAALAALAAGEARSRAAKATVEESTAKIVRAEADVQVAEAHVAVAEAGLQRTRSLLDSATLRAPFDGVVTRRTAGVGDFSQAAGQGNAKSLVTVARTDRLRIVFELPESLISKIATGTPATIRIDAYPNKQFEGKVSRVGVTLDAKTRLLRAEIDLPNPEARLLPGMSATVTLKSQE